MNSESRFLKYLARGLERQGLLETGLCRRAIAFRDVEIAEERVARGDVRIHLDVELLNLDRGGHVLPLPAQPLCEHVQRRRAKVVAAPTVVPLSQILIFLERRRRSRLLRRPRQDVDELFRFRHAAMAGDALHLYRTIECGRRDQSLVYLTRHLHHRTGRALRRLGVGGEIIVVEVGGILSDVAVIAAHAQRAGEPAHDADDFGAARIGG